MTIEPETGESGVGQVTQEYQGLAKISTNQVGSSVLHVVQAWLEPVSKQEQAKVAPKLEVSSVAHSTTGISKVSFQGCKETDI